ncbi:UNVERIFIED_CONTAM: hypothetical protein FKN15_024185 [Acipenser sinensis]
MVFGHEPHSRTGTMLLKSDEELVETLEDNQVQLQNLMTSKYIAHFLKEVSSWQQKLSTADSVISIWFEVQRTWTHLESIFIGSEDIRSQLPEDSKRFDGIDKDFKEIMTDAVKTPNVVEATNKPGLFEKLEHLESSLALCEKALAEYLETKRLAFPRFYFVSSADLLDILSNGNDPVEVSKHLSKLFDSMSDLEFKKDADNKPIKIGLGMYSKENEYVQFEAECDCSGQVEHWLTRVLEAMCSTLRNVMGDAVVTYEEKAREVWVFDYPAQPALTSTQIWWTTEVGIAFARLEEGFENAIKEYFKKQVSQLNTLINLLIGNLSRGDRQKIMTICTIDVHARDVVGKIVTAKVENSQAFTWQSQLRHRWDDEKKHCFANICDAQFRYSYEYLGNTPRLVITPLTDRCYITLTQSLHLIMGGAPAGPAGTGKTETTKDLGRALGIMVYVFNCSEQMDYKSCGDIYKGLAQTGAWGCFDEFNRISVEVLSVIAVQVKCVQDGIRNKKTIFNFLGEVIKLIPTVGVFITMNPGYAGRAELPENLKALFRPCAMVVPDFELICEIMLVAEGFLDARILARKFITLYTLCKELLSKQDHYDWGLRAIKSVLVVAGSLKRGDPGRPEDQVLMRALRDFNVPKIVTDDMPVFMGLIGDLFPALDVPRKRDLDFEKIVKQSVLQLKLQAEDNFVLKVVQLEELLAVRHSVFIIGNAGTGKSQVLKSLNKTYQTMKRKPVAIDLDPKAVTCDELFGIINPATREWKDGLFSCIMRDLAIVSHDGPKWIVLDGDIDPMWIESLNTVMDDNKVLTLASNERIPLNPTMRLVFEISHLRTATPATVSRAGILYINPADLGWNPVVTSWIEKREVQSEKANLIILFDKYLPTCLEKLKIGFKKITPLPEVTMVQTLLYLMECLLIPANAPPDSPKDLYELYFVFSCIWAFGGAMFQDQMLDYRVEFSKWWVNEFKTIKFPSLGTVFDYYIDPDTKKFMSWADKVPKFVLDPDLPLQASMVHTSETIRIRYFMDMLMEKKRPLMLVGNAGTGKSVLMGEKLRSLNTDNYVVQSVPFNFYTTSAMLQAILEKPLEKKAGRNYGPPGNKSLIYFIDDMNMPEVDKYGTVAPHTLIRQHMDHGHWYDRSKLTLKDIHNCQYVACMNPTSGSFTIDPRLQGLLFSSAECVKTNTDMIRLWLHETDRVYGDKLINDKDKELFAKIQVDICRKTFEDMDENVVFAKPNIYSHFACGIGEPKYFPLPSWKALNKLLTEALDSYNEVNAAMNLVLFEDAMSHICKINRILESPRGNALLVGVGGSGKQSLSRLAAAISSLEVSQITLRKGYTIADLKVGNRLHSPSQFHKLDLAALYIKAGVKNCGMVFLMTDSQVAEEQFLVLINDLLASGEIPGLFSCIMRDLAIVSHDGPKWIVLDGDIDPMWIESLNTVMDDNKLKLQAEDNFVLKVVQLEELLAVRHSVFIIGNAGTGKSQVLKSLNKTYQTMKRKPVAIDLDPKAVTCDELFGIINPATREWKDGLFSCIMRDLAIVSHDGPKWIVLDGDIDPMWIESLNTVMDDNKVLTLASNERIPLNPTMRLVFEISHLRTATPATVSRAGILYINPADLGWNPVVTSWIEKREVQSEKANLIILFDKYLPTCLEKLKIGFKKITPLPEVTMVQTLLYLMECLLIPANAPPDSPKDLYELYFVFSCIWAFGGAMFQDQMLDYRVEFSKWWVNEFKTIKFPSLGTVFDYYIDPDTKKFMSWADKVPKFVLDPDLPLQASMVHTSETIRIRYFMDMLMEKKRPLMLVGNAGTGKSVLMGEKLRSLNTDNYVVQSVPFNFYTTSAMLQAILEKPLEKKAGRNYGPPGNKSLIYFIDDMNMPEVDKYGTVAPHTLIRQHMDHGHWYDRSKLTLKDIHNCQYVACMNPTSGSFTIDPRLQRHFFVFAVSFPGQEALHAIYSTILSQHLSMNSFAMALQKFCAMLVAGALSFHQKITSSFLPTAVKFHYVFNLRDLSNIFQGLLFSSAECVKTNTDMIRLWLHETDRVYGDKLINDKDKELFAKIQVDICRKTFEDMDENVVFAKPNIYSHFACGIGEPKYFPLPSWKALNKLLTEALDSYNEVNAAMNLVLFEDAMSHICKINRILESPRGNALLVGVGGSGKQSLSRLAAAISSLEVSQITLRKGYTIADLKLDLAALYIKAGVKNCGMVFLMTDSQVAEEQFLVLINDLLASGEIPGLFPDDEVENIIGSMRNEVKGIGLQDTRENCWKFFIDKVRRQLKVVLCFSPVGSTLRVRARKFPAVVNCTAIDWFHEWPEEALMSVSARFLQDSEGILPEVRTSLSLFMAYVHKTVNEMSKTYLTSERRYNYTTPKTFLEQIKLYQNLLFTKRKELIAKMDRLENGLTKLENTSAQVDDLKAKLAVQEVELQQKNEDADKLIQVVGVETEKVSKEKAIANDEELKVQVINKNVGEKQVSCETDLAKAEPALIAAQEALNTLNKNNLTELKSFGSPPDAVVNVAEAVMILLAPGGKIPKDRSWKAAKVCMAKVDAFLDSLVHYDKEHIPDTCLKAFQPFKNDPTFEPDFIRSKSIAAAGLCSWCINIVRFYEVYCEVEPKRLALAQANAELAAAQDKLSVIKSKITQLNANLAKLTSEFEKATADKLKCQQEADSTNRTISLANRLVGGLASEKIRWSESVARFKEQEKTLSGDVMLISAFVSYVGYFTKKYRNDLMDKYWMPYLKELKVPIPITPGLDPLTLLTDDADIAAWNNQGLPSDRMSIENATILCNTERWPLIVDAQLQGIKWIKNKYGKELKVIRLGQKGYLESIERAISNGEILLIENIGETVEPVLDPLLGRNTIKKGRYIKMGDKEVEYHPNFRLILHTKYFSPHYKPEMQAQCTLINFLVTRDGLEDQLLAAVVAKERPDLEELKAQLTTQQNEFKIVLKQLEDSLLARLSAASGNFLGDTALVENLETTKQTATEIEQKAFNVVFENAILHSEPADEVTQRVNNLIDEITFSVFVYTTRSLFERDKLIFTAQVAFQAISDMDEFKNLNRDIEGSAKRWKKFVESEAPEKEKFPQEWKNKSSLQKLCMMRCLRPDRMSYAVRNFVEEKLGAKYVEGRSVEFSKSYEESSSSTPMFFILSPGVDPLKDVEALGKKLGFTFDNGKFHNVSLGQGQEVVAENAMDAAAKKGHWVILQNIHLVAKWLGTLDKKVELYSTGSHNDYRVYMSAEPAPTPDSHIIPQGLLENAIKITNEPPTGMHANLHKALDLFDQDTLDMCTKESEFKCILFSLCYFHAVVAERRKFGAQGWNRSYPFNNGDLTISVNVLFNYLEANPKVPWDDLRYLFGEIMYGGHITDDWDRKLCKTYLEEYVRPELLEGELQLAPGFLAPPNSDYKGYHAYLDDMLPPESPYLYGLHPNAEIGFLTITSEKLFRTVLEMQPKDSEEKKNIVTGKCPLFYHIGKKLGFTFDNGKFHNVSLGQGQEVVAENAMDAAAKKGHWVILQNIHLVAKWLGTLDKKVELYSTGSHNDYRVYMSAEPAPTPDSHIIPQGLLENAIKITNEPPTGMHANLHKALDLFDQDTLDMCTKESEFKCILFSLCYFHAVVAERRKFGAQGWNRSYPFNNGDLTISVNVLFNYLEANPKVPWDDLRYLFGEIMYGGHITDDWDRKLCKTYLEEYVRPELLEGELQLAPGFLAPPNSDYKGYHAYLDDMLPPESPYLYGLHPNAEIGFLTITSEKLFRTVLEMQPKDSEAAGGAGVSREEKVKGILDEILEKLPEQFNLLEIMAKVEDRTPYIVVAFQECERMNILTKEMRRSLKELDLGLKGELTITTVMEELSNSLFFDTVPESWTKRAYPSLQGMGGWFADLLLRIKELESWTSDFSLPNAVWLAGFFNPQSFLTAIMQAMARKNEWPLDKMCLAVEVTKKNREDMTAPPREGAYIHGLFMEGARWDIPSGVIAEARLKELTPSMPVIFVKAIPVDRQETKNIYECPVYKTRIRGPTFVWTFNLKTKERSAKWVLAAVCLLLQV